MLEKPNKKIEAVYFPETGFASVVAVQRNGKQVEIGLIGREGMTRFAYRAWQPPLAACDPLYD